ncbi:MAG: AsmA family protein [Chromatiaceae bacterium]|nr:MAG: AsmA family protein [Chromatiaceae bacterium]
MRIAALLALLLGLLLFLLLLAPLAVNRDRLAEQVAAAVTTTGEHQLYQARRPRVALLPRPHLLLGPLRIEAVPPSHAPSATLGPLRRLLLEEARADLALRPLLGGRLELARVTLTGLQVELVSPEYAALSAPPAMPPIASVPDPAPDPVEPIPAAISAPTPDSTLATTAISIAPAPGAIAESVAGPAAAPVLGLASAPPAGVLSEPAPPPGPGLLPVHRLLVQDAQVHWYAPRGRAALSLTGIELSAGPLVPGATGTLHGTLDLQHRATDIDAALTLTALLTLAPDLSRIRLDPLRLQARARPDSGTSSDDLAIELTATLTLAPAAGWLQIADLAFATGSLRLTGAAKIDLTQTPVALTGRLALAPLDLRTWLAAHGHAPLPGHPGTWRRVAAAADFTLADGRLHLPAVDLELDASRARATGWLTLSAATPPTGRFTAALDQIDLDPYLIANGAATRLELSAAAATDAPAGSALPELPELPELLAPSPGMTLRLQAGALRLGRLQQRDVALTARHDPVAPRVSADHLELHSADFYQGRLHGQLHRTHTQAAAAPTLTLALTATGVAMTDLLHDLLPPGSVPALSGTGDLKLDLRGQGETLADLRASLGGAARLGISDGRLTLADLDALLAAHVTAGGNPGTGAKAVTAFDRLSLSATGDQGQFHSDDIAVQAPRYHLSGSASANVAAETLALDLTAVLIEPPHAAARGLAGIPIPVAASGRWSALAWQVDLSPALAAAARRALQERGLLDELEERTGIPGLRQGLERGLERGLEQGLRGLFGR